MWTRIVLAQLRSAHHKNVQSGVVRHPPVLISSYCTQVDTSLGSQVREVGVGVLAMGIRRGECAQLTRKEPSSMTHHHVSVKAGQDTA